MEEFPTDDIHLRQYLFQSHRCAYCLPYIGEDDCALLDEISILYIVLDKAVRQA